MNHKELDCLEVAAEAFEFEQVNFDEMIQREIDVRSESPRVCQRLNNLRNWNYEKIKSLYIRIS